MRVYASSDHHFYHKNIIKYANRPFDINDPYCVIDNAKMMISRHNDVITNDDVALFVGDLSASLRGRNKHFSDLLKLLNGKKILIRGNHDKKMDKFYLDAGFIDVVDYMLIEPYFINHYPCVLTKWTTPVEKSMMALLKNKNVHTIIHGHIHNKNPDNYMCDWFNRINVCVDYTPNNFYPQELKQPEIVSYVTKRYG